MIIVIETVSQTVLEDGSLKYLGQRDLFEANHISPFGGHIKICRPLPPGRVKVIYYKRSKKNATTINPQFNKVKTKNSQVI